MIGAAYGAGAGAIPNTALGEALMYLDRLEQICSVRWRGLPNDTREKVLLRAVRQFLGKLTNRTQRKGEVMDTSGTPRTDAAAYDDDGRTYLEHSIVGKCVSADFARELERELSESKRERDQLSAAYGALTKSHTSAIPDYDNAYSFADNLERYVKQRTKAAEAALYDRLHSQ